MTTTEILLGILLIGTLGSFSLGLLFEIFWNKRFRQKTCTSTKKRRKLYTYNIETTSKKVPMHYHIATILLRGGEKGDNRTIQTGFTTFCVNESRNLYSQLLYNLDEEFHSNFGKDKAYPHTKRHYDSQAMATTLWEILVGLGTEYPECYKEFCAENGIEALLPSSVKVYDLEDNIQIFNAHDVIQLTMSPGEEIGELEIFTSQRDPEPTQVEIIEVNDV